MLHQRPSSTRIKDREILREHVIHRARLVRVSSRIDNSSPRPMSHIKNNLKKKLFEQNKKEEIINSNKILVSKLLRVNTRDNSLKRGRPPNFLNNSKKYEEINKITNENYRILNKIKKSKPHYSSERLRQEYRLANTLKNRISQNSGRVPKIINFTQFEFNFNNSSRQRSAKSLHNSGKYDFLIQ